MITVHRNTAPPDWDAFVRRSPSASTYHASAWPAALATIFDLEAYYITDRRASSLTGLLPLLRQRSRVFGDRLISLPYVNYGGVLADDESSRDGLHERAIELARQLRVQRIELRDTAPPPKGWSCRTDKVTLRLPLPSSVEELAKSFGSKLRSQIKRAGREPFELKIGGAERVDEFYPVFAEVMRDLGTPVYPRRFFAELARRLAEHCTVLTIHRHGRTVAGAFLVGDRGLLEIPWAGTIASEKSKATNMLLYAEVLKLAVERGYLGFDFGRSTVDSGPYRFKRQWGAEPVQLHWATWPEESPTARPGEPGLMSKATQIWSRLPLAVANRLGPIISPSLPW